MLAVPAADGRGRVGVAGFGRSSQRVGLKPLASGQATAAAAAAGAGAGPELACTGATDGKAERLKQRLGSHQVPIF